MANVLLVADDDQVRDEVESALAGPRSQVVTVADSRAAVQRARAMDPSTILIDLQVGSMGGMAVVRNFLDAFALSDMEPIPLVLLLDREADTFLAGRSGADKWIVKPFTAQELRATLASESTV